MRIDVLTLFPALFEPFFRTSIVGRAREAGCFAVECTDIRDFTHDVHRSVDDKPFGGGPGMVMMCGPVFEAFEFVCSTFGTGDEDVSGSGVRHPAGPATRPQLVMLTPQGEPLNQRAVADLAAEPWLVLLCGHYEGFDERIRTGLAPREISVGDYVLSGGETAAMVLIDAVVRLLPGALGSAASSVEESFAGDLLEYPQYTRPREFRGMSVPEVLVSGHHERVAAWRREQALARTRHRRPDLLDDGRDG